MTATSTHERCLGMMYGLMVGDALGAQVEFRTPEQVARTFGLGELAFVKPPVFGGVVGQLSDDSEMALSLAWALSKSKGEYVPGFALSAYRRWQDSSPPDIGMTTSMALRGVHSPAIPANGALMRVAPLAIAGLVHGPRKALRWAIQDCMLTHIHPMCSAANVAFVGLLLHTLNGEITAAADAVFRTNLAEYPELEEVVLGESDPKYHEWDMGYVAYALRLAYRAWASELDFYDAMVDVIHRGGDTDTNAAIAGALLGAKYGESGIPEGWVDVVLQAEPGDRPATLHARNAPNLVDMITEGKFSYAS